MELLARVQAGSRAIACGRAITTQERAAVLAQRFRVYERRGYYRAGVTADRDVYDENAIYFLATLPDARLGDVLLGSARLIFGEPRADFKFPVDHAFEFDLPQIVRRTPLVERVEVSRVVAEAVHGVVIGGLLTPLGLIYSMGQYAHPHRARCGVGVIKQRLLRALHAAGVALHEIQPASLVYPKDGPLCGYYHETDPVVPVWIAEEIGPSIERAIAN
jgi:hypothetical protein